jgi:hypothetical protein
MIGDPNNRRRIAVQHASSSAAVVVLEARLEDALRQRDELLFAIDEWWDVGLSVAADDELMETFRRIRDEVWADS